MKDFVPEAVAQQSQGKQEKSKPTESVATKEMAAEPREPQQHSSTTTPTTPDSSRIIASPAARVIAKDLGIELASVTGTGPGQRITKSDILAHKKESRAAPAQADSASPYVDVPVSNVRRVIAQRLSDPLPPSRTTTSVPP